MADDDSIRRALGMDRWGSKSLSGGRGRGSPKMNYALHRLV